MTNKVKNESRKGELHGSKKKWGLYCWFLVFFLAILAGAAYAGQNVMGY